MSSVIIASQPQVFSRSLLQTLGNDPGYFDRKARLIQMIQQTANEVLKKAKAGQTKYMINTTNYLKENKTETIKEEMMKEIKNLFPECSVELHETKGYNGDLLEALIIIDWS